MIGQVKGTNGRKCMQTVPKSITDPDTAAWWMFGRVELERGVQFDEDVKQKMMWQWAVCILRPLLIPC